MSEPSDEKAPPSPRALALAWLIALGVLTVAAVTSVLFVKTTERGPDSEPARSASASASPPPLAPPPTSRGAGSGAERLK